MWLFSQVVSIGLEYTILCETFRLTYNTVKNTMWSDYELNYSMNVVAPVPGATGVAVIYGQDEDNDNSSIHIFHKILVIKKVFYNVKRNVTVRLISITLIRTAQVIKVKNSISEVLGYSENLIFEFLARFVSAKLAKPHF